MYEEMLGRLQTLRKGGRFSAAWLQGASSIATEIVAQAGFDVLVVDLEHAPGDIAALVQQLQAMKGEPGIPFVRTPWNDPIWIKRVLDAGAWGLIVPSVSSADEARQAVQAAKFPPRGTRGIAGSHRAAGYGKAGKEYFESADNNVVLVQIETPGGVEHLDKILSVDDLDGVFIGPMDLATTHGFRGRPDAPAVMEIIAGIERRVLAAGKLLASIAFDSADAKAKYDRGYNILMLMHDTVTLGQVARRQVADFQAEFGTGSAR